MTNTVHSHSYVEIKNIDLMEAEKIVTADPWEKVRHRGMEKAWVVGAECSWIGRMASNFP
jgi:hypothetical protein